jgi:hypothetical protein
MQSGYVGKKITVCGTGVLSNHKGKFQIKIADLRSLTFR